MVFIEETKGLEGITFTPEERAINSVVKNVESDIRKYLDNRDMNIIIGGLTGVGSLISAYFSAYLAGSFPNANNLVLTVGLSSSLVLYGLSIVCAVDSVRNYDHLELTRKKLEIKKADPIYKTLVEKLEQLS